MRKRISLLVMAALLFIVTFSIDACAKTMETPSYLPDEYTRTDVKTANIFIGDSRTVLIEYYMGISEYPDTFVIAKSGMGYDWLVDEAIGVLKEIQKNNHYNKYNIIFNLGVNDLYNLDKYVAILPELEKYGTLYYVSVNPVVEGQTQIEKDDILTFNNIMYEEVDNYIDSYSYLFNHGYESPDGLHFDEKTSKLIYNYIMLKVAEKEYTE